MRRLLPGVGGCMLAPESELLPMGGPATARELCACAWTEASDHTATFSTTSLSLPSVTGHEASSGPRAGTGRETG